MLSKMLPVGVGSPEHHMKHLCRLRSESGAAYLQLTTAGRLQRCLSSVSVA